MKLFSPIYYETPAGVTGGAGAPGTPQPTTPQSGAPDQGQGQGNPFRQQHFANVPDEHWALIEPHMGGINKHVTQMEQRYAPFRGYTPEAVQGLAQFAQAYDQNPIGAWIQTARALQTSGILDNDIDLDYLEALTNGEDPDAAPAGGAVPPPGQQQGEQIPAWAQTLTQRLEAMEQGFTGFQQTQQQRQQDAAINRQVSWMKSQLQEAGVTEDLLTEERLLSSFIVHRGNAQAAVKDLMDFRTGLLKGVVPTNPAASRQEKNLDLPNGAPQTGVKSGPRKTRGMFRDVTAAAEQALSRANQTNR